MDEKKKLKQTDNPYDNKQVEEMIEQDEIDPEEAGFMEGYNEKQTKDPKKPKDIINDEK